jgi:hypothetical protein
MPRTLKPYFARACSYGKYEVRGTTSSVYIYKSWSFKINIVCTHMVQETTLPIHVAYVQSNRN